MQDIEIDLLNERIEYLRDNIVTLNDKMNEILDTITDFLNDINRDYNYTRETIAIDFEKYLLPRIDKIIER